MRMTVAQGDRLVSAHLPAEQGEPGEELLEVDDLAGMYSAMVRPSWISSASMVSTSKWITTLVAPVASSQSSRGHHA